MRLYIGGVEVSYSGTITFKLQQAEQLGELIGLVANDTVEVAATKELNTALGEVAYRFKGGEIDFTGVIEDDKGICTNVVATLQDAKYKSKQIKSYSFILKTGNAAWFEQLRNMRVMDVYPLSETPASDDNWLKPDKDPESTTIMYAYAVGADNWRGRSYVRYDDGFRFISPKTVLNRGFSENGLSFFSGSDPAFDVIGTIYLPVSKQWNGKAIEIAQVVELQGTVASGIGIEINQWTTLTDNYNALSGILFGAGSYDCGFRAAFTGTVNIEVYFNGVLDPTADEVVCSVYANDALAPVFVTTGNSNSVIPISSGEVMTYRINSLAGVAVGTVVRIVVTIANAEPQWNPNAYCDPAMFIPEQWTVADVLKGCASLFDLRIKTEGNDVTCLPPLTSELLNGDYSEQYLKAPSGLVELDLMVNQDLKLTDVKKATYLKYVDPQIASYQEIADANNWTAWAGLFGEEDTDFNTYETYKFVAAPNALCASVSVVGQPTTLLPSIVVADNTDAYRPVIVDMVPMLERQSEDVPTTKWSSNFGATTTTKHLFRFFQYNKFTNSGMQLTFGSYDANPSLGEGLNRLKINQILDNRKLTARFGYWNGKPDVTIGIDSTTWNIAGGNYTPAKGTLNELTLLPIDNTSPTDVSKQLELNIIEFDPRDGYAAEAQTLSIVGSDLSISGGNTVALPSGGTPSLTEGQIAFGDASGLMTSSNDLIWDGAQLGVNGSVAINGSISAGGSENSGISSSIIAGQSTIGDWNGNINYNRLTVDDNNSLAYYDNPSHDGKFGINTTTPSVALDVVGDVDISGVIKLGTDSGTAGQVLTSNGASNPTWQTPSGDPTMGGDLSGTASNAQIVAGAVGSAELASTSVVPGSYTFTSLTVDADGRLTAASSGVVPASPFVFNLGSDFTNSGTNIFQSIGMSFTPVANSYYQIEIFGQRNWGNLQIYSLQLEMSGFQFTQHNLIVRFPTATTADVILQSFNSSGGATTITAATANTALSGIRPVIGSGGFQTGASVGTVTFQIRTNIGSGGIQLFQLRAGFTIVITKLS